MIHNPYRNLPSYMVDGLRRYIEDGIPPGDFLTAVIRNQLVQAYLRADDTNIQKLREYVIFMYHDAPADCWGSDEKMKKWIKRGGLNGTED